MEKGIALELRAQSGGQAQAARACALPLKMPTRCVGPGRLRRGVRRPRARRWGVGMTRSYRARRRARLSVRERGCTSAEILQDCRRPLGRRQARETTASSGTIEASGVPDTAGSAEAVRDPKAVWVNGAVGEPEVVGPAGSVWVTRSGEEEDADDRSTRGSDRKGRPGALGQESILELWLKVQAMRVASGCWEGSRVELHPVPAGEGPVERGVPGRASWVETSQGGVTGPWVRGQARALPRASILPTALRLGGWCERVSGLYGQGEVRKATSAVGRPGVAGKTSCAVVPDSWEREQTMGTSGTMRWPGTVGGPGACEVKRGLCVGGQSAQTSGALVQEEAGCGDAPALWGREKTAGPPDSLIVPEVMEEETSVGGGAMRQNRQKMKNVGSGGVPGLWSTGQPVGVPCVSEQVARCGGDTALSEEEPIVLVDTGSGDDLGSWEAALTTELSASREQEAGSQGTEGLWCTEQTMGVPRALGKEADCTSGPGLWGTRQLPGVSRAKVVPGGRGEGFSFVPDLLERQQTLGVPMTETAPGPVGEDAHSGNILSLWKRRQVTGEQEPLMPMAVGIPGPGGGDAGCGAVSCLCGRRQAMFETVAIPEHRRAPERVPTALGVPAALWGPRPVCQENSWRNDVHRQERPYATEMPLTWGRPMAPEERSSVIEHTGSGLLPGSWERRPDVGAPMAPGAPTPAELETDSGDLSGLSGQSQTARIPVAPRAPHFMQEETSSRRVSVLVGGSSTAGEAMAVGPFEPTGQEPLCEDSGKQAVAMPMTTRVTMTVGVPTTSGLPAPHRVEDSGCGECSGIWQRRQTVARIPRLVEREFDFEGSPTLWRNHNGTVPEPDRRSLPQGMLATVGVPIAGHIPAAMWVTRSSREEAGEGTSDLTVVRRQSTGGTGTSGNDIRGRGILGLAGRGQTMGVSYTHEHGTGAWGSPRSVGEETVYENVLRVMGTRTAVPLVSCEETGLGHFRDGLEQSGRRPVSRVPGVRVKGDDLEENCVGEERLRRTSH